MIGRLVYNMKRVNKFFLLSILFGVITTTYLYSGYGYSDQVEHLPAIFRSIDSSFLEKDFLTNANSQTIVRHYYSVLLSVISGSQEKTASVLLILLFVSNVLISVSSFIVAKKLFNNSNITGIYAAALVMSLTSFEMGTKSHLFYEYLTPSALATATVFLATGLFFSKRYISGFLLLGLTSFIHPQMGIVSAGIFVFTYAVNLFLNQKRYYDKNLIIMSAIFTAFSLFFIIHFLKENTQGSDNFVFILTEFRLPHHYIISSFTKLDLLYSFSFITAVSLLFIRYRNLFDKTLRRYIAIISISILSLCFLGYIFIEIYPTKIFASIQPLRYLIYIKFFGLIILAGIITNINKDKLRQTLFTISLLNPLSLLITSIWDSMRNNKIAKIVSYKVLIVIIVSFIIYDYPRKEFIILFLLFLLLINITKHFSLHQRTYLFLLFIPILIITASFQNERPFLSKANLSENLRNRFDLSIKTEIDSYGLQVIDFVKTETPDNSIFLTPANWGQFRLLAKRAIVVDFKSFVSSEKAMTEWYERLLTCYKPFAKTGFDVIDEMNQNYKNISDAKLKEIKSKYQASYAVLYAETETDMPTLYQNSKYKLVKIR